MGGHVCERCGRCFDSARGLGSHLSTSHPGTPHLVTCRTCGKRRRLWANSMCRRCCDKVRHAPRTCRECGGVKRHHSSGRCARCHRRASRSLPRSGRARRAWPVAGLPRRSWTRFLLHLQRDLDGRCRGVSWYWAHLRDKYGTRQARKSSGFGCWRFACSSSVWRFLGP